MNKMWIIYDGRSIDNTDDASVYVALEEEDGETRKSALKIRDEDWPDGFVFEYDINEKNELINKLFIG